MFSQCRDWNCTVMDLVEQIVEEAPDAVNKDSEMPRILAVGLGDGGEKLELRSEQRNRIEQSQLLAVPRDLNGSPLGAGRRPGDSSNHFDVRAETANPDRNGTGQ